MVTTLNTTIVGVEELVILLNCNIALQTTDLGSIGHLHYKNMLLSICNALDYREIKAIIPFDSRWTSCQWEVQLYGLCFSQCGMPKILYPPQGGEKHLCFTMFCTMMMSVISAVLIIYAVVIIYIPAKTELESTLQVLQEVFNTFLRLLTVPFIFKIIMAHHRPPFSFTYLRALCSNIFVCGQSRIGYLYMATPWTYFGKFLCCWANFYCCKWPHVKNNLSHVGTLIRWMVAFPLENV